MVRAGDFKSDYSSDEEKDIDSDDSAIEKNKARVGVTAAHRDNHNYVDAMVNRHNETDQRLLRASLNDKHPSETGQHSKNTEAQPPDYSYEADMENQEFTKKIDFDTGKP